MQSFTNRQPEARLNAHDLFRDYTQKVSAACPLAMVHHEQDERGATLVVHIPKGTVDAAEAGGTLADRLAKLVESLPRRAESGSAAAQGTPAAGEGEKAPKRSRQVAKKTEEPVSDEGTNGAGGGS